jgi:RNA recognition motif-containing protein
MPRKIAVSVKSLFVCGLDENVLKDDLLNYFDKFGNITNVNLQELFATITYDDYDPVDKVIRMSLFVLFFSPYLF